MIECGFGERMITPPLGTPCSLGVDDEAEEIFDDIFARALAFRQDATRVLIVAVDVIGLTAPDAEDIRRAVRQATGWPDAGIVVHATHTHHAPNVRYHAYRPVIEAGFNPVSVPYYRCFLEAIGRAARAAVDDLSAVTRSGWGECAVQGIASNRRIVTAGGIVMRFSRPPEELKAYPEGHIDPLVRCLVLERARRPAVVWANYHGHPTGTGGDEGPYVSGDFPGWAIHLLKRELADHHVIYMTGPQGDVNPGKYTTGDPSAVEDRKRDRDRMGRRMADAVRAAVERAGTVKAEPLDFRQERIMLERNPEFAGEGLEEACRRALAELAAAHAQGRRVGMGGAIRKAQTNRFMDSLFVDGRIPALLSACRIGEAAAVFFPGEIFLEAADRLRNAFPGARLLTVALADGIWGYIPTPEAYDQGGYEVGVAYVARSGFGRLVERAVEQLGSLGVDR